MQSLDIPAHEDKFMLNFFKRLSRSRAAYRAASYAIAIVLVACPHAAVGMRAAQIFA